MAMSVNEIEEILPNFPSFLKMMHFWYLFFFLLLISLGGKRCHYAEIQPSYYSLSLIFICYVFFLQTVEPPPPPQPQPPHQKEYIYNHVIFLRSFTKPSKSLFKL